MNLDQVIGDGFDQGDRGGMLAGKRKRCITTGGCGREQRNCDVGQRLVARDSNPQLPDRQVTPQVVLADQTKVVLFFRQNVLHKRVGLSRKSRQAMCSIGQIPRGRLPGLFDRSGR